MITLTAFFCRTVTGFKIVLEVLPHIMIPYVMNEKINV